jgi:hypothetical protein
MFSFNPEVKVALIFFVTQGLKAAGIAIEGNVAKLVAAVVGAVLFFGEALIPPENAATVSTVVEFVFYILAAFGLYGSAKAVGLVAPKA